MKIYYKKNNINNINNFENICTKENYEFEINDKIYINKIYNKDAIMKKEFEIEKNKFFLVKKRSKNNILFKSFFIEYILITECENNFIIVMEKMNENDHKFDSYFLKNINNIEKNNLLFQVLVTIYDMNHYNKIFFNNNYDIDKNIIILNNNEKRNIEYVFNDNVKLIVPINKYKIKFNDYLFRIILITIFYILIIFQKTYPLI
jgi:hypothetical protein